MGRAVWQVILACSAQLRAVDSAPFALDFPAFLAMADLADVELTFIADLLPAIEPFIVAAWTPEPKS